jgi:NAD(P)-dependent dehydrogenase (short-subunit alcohol dehydrogenase family)
MGKVLIIGGTKGIGRAIVSEVIEEHEVVCLSRNISDFTHNNYKHIKFDVLNDEFPEIESLDTLIYCPGTINLKPISTLTTDDFRYDFELNVIGAVKAIKKYLNLLKKSENPSILMFSTVATKLGMPYHSSVSVSKSGIDGLVKTLGAELAPKIRINAIAPTITNTDLASKILRNEKVIENMIERHPLKKILSPDEIAKMASYLISKNSSSISGQIFNMDAGIVSFKS